MTLFRNVNIVKENTVEKGEVLVRDGKIAEVAPTIETPPETEIVDGGGRYLSPGFIDLHVHGGGGYSAMGGKDAVVKMCEAHARYGTPSILPTPLAAPTEQ